MTVPRSERHLRPIAEWRDDMIAEQTVWCPVQGYATPMAVGQGEPVGLCISSRTSRFGIRISRDGAAEEVVVEREIDGAEEREVISEI